MCPSPNAFDLIHNDKKDKSMHVNLKWVLDQKRIKSFN